MEHDDWAAPSEEPLIFRLSGTAFEEADEFGGEIRTSSLLVIMHAAEDDIEVTLPEPNGEMDHAAWDLVITTDDAYHTTPPTSPVGKRQAENMTRLRRDLGCPPYREKR